MNKAKKRRIQANIMIPLLTVLIVGIAAQTIILAIFASNITRDLSLRIANQGTERYANELQGLGGENYGIVSTLAPVIAGNRTVQGDETAREDAVAIMSEAVDSNSEIVAIWTAWEPDAYDGDDASHIGEAPYHDGTGRFVPYVLKDGDSVILEPLEDYEDPVKGDYYQGVKAARAAHATSPYEYVAGGESKYIFSVAVPILDGDAFKGVVGVDIEMGKITEMMNRAQILDVGYVFTISQDGTIATHPDEELMGVNYRDIWLGEYGDEIENMMQTGESMQIVTYSDVLGEEVIWTANPIKFSQGDQYWIVNSIVPMSKVNEASNTLTLIIIVAGALLVLLVTLILYRVIKKNLKSLPAVSKVAETLADGDISVDLGEVMEGETKNEIEQLKQSFAKLVESTSKQVENVQRVAAGDFAFDVEVKSGKDLLNIAIADMVQSNNQVFGEINTSSGQVAIGADQVSHGAQSLAQGATEQAATVQELAETLGTTSEKIAHSADAADEVSKKARSVGADMAESNEKMQALVEAMDKIRESSGEIGKIIQTIEDIAFQTNILALNAAVEAARAGAAGQGFAVVADEVRNLASKSAEASKNTAVLIEGSIAAVKSGSSIAHETAEALLLAVQGTQEIVEKISEISESTKTQSAAITQVFQGVDQISTVVQTNSATAQESAAASEELSGQAQIMRELVARFKLSGNGNFK